MTTKVILGIDSSSETIGLGVLEINLLTNDIKYLSCEYVKPPKDGNISERIFTTRNQIQEIINRIKPDYIAIEEIVQFMKGKSSANTIIMLTTFNRMNCLIARDYLGHSPELFNVLSIRHGIKLSKVLPKKEELPFCLEQHLNFKFPFEYTMKKVKTSKVLVQGKIKDVSYDMSDALCVALHYARILTGKHKKKK